MYNFLDNIYLDGAIFSAIMTLVYFYINILICKIETGKTSNECCLPFALYFLLSLASWGGFIFSFLMSITLYKKYKNLESEGLES